MKRTPARAEVLAIQDTIAALDHPIRQRVLALLYREASPRAYNEIAQRLGIDDSSAIAHHLKVLVGAALVGNELTRVNGRIKSLYFITKSGGAWLDKAGLAEPERIRVLLEA